MLPINTPVKANKCHTKVIGRTVQEMIERPKKA